MSGSLPPFLMRETSSPASSIIVRSALNAVSKTLSNPMRLRAAVMMSAMSLPGFMPNSSAMVTEMLGACWTTTVLPGSLMASRTAAMLLRSDSAPVGQTLMHWPQLMQLETFNPSSNAVPILALLPLPMKSIAETPWISSHTLTHLPQRMHFEGSRTMAGLERSMFCGVPAPLYRLCLTPRSWARSCRSHPPLRTQ